MDYKQVPTDHQTNQSSLWVATVSTRLRLLCNAPSRRRHDDAHRKKSIREFLFSTGQLRFLTLSVLLVSFFQGVLMLQDQYRATLLYSNSRHPADSRSGGGGGGGASGSTSGMDNATDWYCSKCLVFNFKRRENCFKCYASREESEKGADGWDEISNVLTKSRPRFFFIYLKAT